MVSEYLKASGVSTQADFSFFATQDDPYMPAASSPDNRRCFQVLLREGHSAHQIFRLLLISPASVVQFVACLRPTEQAFAGHQLSQ